MYNILSKQGYNFIGSFPTYSRQIFSQSYRFIYGIVLSIISDCKMHYCVFVKIWSLRVQLLRVVLIGQLISCLNPYVEQTLVYFLMSVENSLCNFEECISFWSRLKPRRI